MVEPAGWSELSAGDAFAGYRIEQRLGRGGMGILYLAIEPGLERRVALKLIAPEAAAERVFAQRFAEESRIAAAIEHPNVVPIYAAGEHDGVPYIAMRYVAGSDLARRLAREERLQPERAVALSAQVAAGLDAIHAAGLVHRDVKPANVLLSGEPGAEHAYITDFGVARNVATESGLTQTGRFVGTLDYVAPEQISGGPIDARADVYALGCLLFKLLTGEVPFPREGEAARLYAHLNEPPPAPSLQVPAAGEALDEVIARALAKQPGDRYPSAGDLGRAASAALRGTPLRIPERTVATGAAATVEAKRPAADASPASGRLHPGPPQPLTEPVVAGPQRNRLLIGTALAAIAAIVVVGFIVSSDGGGEGGDPTAAGETVAAPADSTAGQRDEPRQSEPQPGLSTQASIARADASCAQAKAAYTRTRQEAAERLGVDPESEAGIDEGFAADLVAISGRQVKQMSSLRPWPADAAQYDRYIELREEVAAYDRAALRAARAGDATAYVTAYGNRNAITPEMERVADAIGFEVCSNNA